MSNRTIKFGTYVKIFYALANNVQSSIISSYFFV